MSKYQNLSQKDKENSDFKNEFIQKKKQLFAKKEKDLEAIFEKKVKTKF